jgi:hypothetical protein
MACRRLFLLVLVLVTHGVQAVAGEQKDGDLTGKNMGSPVARRWIEGIAKRKPKFDALQAKLNPQGTGPVPKELGCPLVLESSYLVAVMDQAHSVEHDGSETFHMVLRGGEDVFDLVYIYSPAGKLVGERIERLPAEWRVVLMRTSSQQIQVISKEGCVFSFDLTDPFLSQVAGVLPAGTLDPSD